MILGTAVRSTACGRNELQPLPSKIMETIFKKGGSCMSTTLANILPILQHQGPTMSIVDFCWQSSVAYTPQAQGVRVPIFGEYCARMTP